MNNVNDTAAVKYARVPTQHTYNDDVFPQCAHPEPRT